jgi:NADH-quinone oxidoreductase subunit H
VSGYNVEYASAGFALFFLAEYGSMILMSAFTILIFFGGWISILFSNSFFDSLVFSVKICCILFFYVWVRASFPRYRVDQLMRLCWKIFLPLSFGFVIFTSSLLFVTNGVF